MIRFEKMFVGMAIAAAMALPGGVQAQSAVDWSGFYAGIQGGIATGAVEVDETYCDVNPCGDPPATLADSFIADYDLSGFRGGAHAGYNHQLDILVLGVVTDINFSRISGDGNYTYNDGVGGPDFVSPENTSSFDLDWEGSTRLIAGVALDNWMPYVTAGVGYGHGTLNSSRNFTRPDPNAEFSTGVALLGVTVGAGVNYAVTEDVILSGEVRHTVYGSELVDEVDSLDNTTTQRVSISNTAAQVGISFRF